MTPWVVRAATSPREESRAGRRGPPPPRELRLSVERREFLRRLRPLRIAAVVAAASVLVEAPPGG